MASKKVSKGKRYTPEEKKTIISFVTEHNAKNGRGGVSVASRKFSVSPLTIGSWIKKGGAAPAAKKAKAVTKARRARKAVKVAKVKRAVKRAKVKRAVKRAKVKRAVKKAKVAKAVRSAKGSRTSVLSALAGLDAKIAKKRVELDVLEAKFAALKASL